MKAEPIEALKEIKRCSWETEDFNISDGFESHEVVDKNDAINIVNIAFREGQSSPKIKQLEWEEYRDCLVSTTPFYNVSIKEVCGIYELATAYSAFIKSYNSLDKAKEVAQSDFEQRVKECLE